MAENESILKYLPMRKITQNGFFHHSQCLGLLTKSDNCKYNDNCYKFVCDWNLNEMIKLSTNEHEQVRNVDMNYSNSLKKLHQTSASMKAIKKKKSKADIRNYIIRQVKQQHLIDLQQ